MPGERDDGRIAGATRVAVVCGVLAALALAGPARPADFLDSADPFPDAPQLTTTRVTESLRLADDYFGVLPPCGRQRVFVAPVLEHGYLAVSQASTCRIWVNPPVGSWLDRIQFSWLIAHEDSHLLLMAHSQDPASVRYWETGGSVFWPGYRRFLPRGAGRAFRDLVGPLPWATL